MTARLEYLWKNDMRYIGQIPSTEENRKSAHAAILRLAQKTRTSQREMETEDAIKRFERKYLHKKNY